MLIALRATINTNVTNQDKNTQNSTAAAARTCYKTNKLGTTVRSKGEHYKEKLSVKYKQS